MGDFEFKITSEIVKQLGEQLVSDEITAILELIKNSYDADATYVDIQINTKGSYIDDAFYPENKGYIIIEDDGGGMSEETILKSWLTISYSKKRKMKALGETTKAGRTPLGDKGLGRLSTQRLADICEIYTKAKKYDGCHIAFDWRHFDGAQTLDQVRVLNREYELDKTHGTYLILSNLKNANVWTGDSLDKFKGQVVKIISPFKETRPFEVYIKIDGEDVDIDAISDGLREAANASFPFSFDGEIISIDCKSNLSTLIGNRPEEFERFILVDGGKEFFDHLKSKCTGIFKSEKHLFCEDIKIEVKTEITDLLSDDDEIANPGAFIGRIDQFSLTQFQESDIFNSLASYKSFIKGQTGIRIYRNGFAIQPYGLKEGNDWMSLSSGQTSGNSYYGLRPANVVGYFAIDEGVNTQLKDKTDREGFITNAYSENFLKLSKVIKNEINNHSERIRREYNHFLKAKKSEDNSFRSSKDVFNEFKKTKERAADFENYDIVVAKAKIAMKESKTLVKNLKGNSLFPSEQEDEMLAMASRITKGLQEMQKTLLSVKMIVESANKLDQAIDILEPKIQTMEEQITYFSELASLGLAAESASHEFSATAQTLAEKSNYYLKKHNKKSLSDADIRTLFEYIKSTVSGLRIQLKHLDPALKYLRNKKETLILSKFLQGEEAYYTDKYKKYEIDFEIVIKEDFEIEINKGSITQIIDNILRNSEYWLKDKKRLNSNFDAKIKIEVSKPNIVIYDNGYGVSKNVENLIFEPFVTTKPDTKGRGLGLFITKQLLDASGCSVFLDMEKNETDRRFKFVINLSNVVK